MTPEEKKQYNKEYKLRNKDKIKEYNKQYKSKNRDAIKERRKEYDDEYRLKNKARLKEYKTKNRDVIKEQMKVYRAKNKEILKKQRNEYEKIKKNIDPLYKTKSNYLCAVGRALRKNGYTKKSRCHEILGCSYEEFNKHLESQFEAWMTWENRGKYKKNEYNYGWDVDHIIPTSSATNEEELIKLFHYTNLRPLCSKVNRDEKKARLDVSI